MTHIVATTECAHCIFFFNDPAPTEIYTLSLHDALPISDAGQMRAIDAWAIEGQGVPSLDLMERARSEEHTSELQSRRDLVCRLLLEKKNKMPASTKCSSASNC